MSNYKDTVFIYYLIYHHFSALSSGTDKAKILCISSSVLYSWKFEHFSRFGSWNWIYFYCSMNSIYLSFVESLILWIGVIHTIIGGIQLIRITECFTSFKKIIRNETRTYRGIYARVKQSGGPKPKEDC